MIIKLKLIKCKKKITSVGYGVTEMKWLIT